MRNPLGKALWSAGFLVLGIGLVVYAFGSHVDRTVPATNAVMAPFVVGLVMTLVSLPIFLWAIFSAVGYARLMSGKGLIARWHVTAGDWDRFRAFDQIRAAEHAWLQNDMHIREQTPPQGVDVIVGRGSIIVDGSYHGITGLGAHGREINWLNAPVDPECIEFPKTYPRGKGGSVELTLRVPVPASARAEGVRVFEHYHPKENPILNPTPARLRLEGTFSLVGGLFIVMVLGALLALMLGAPFPAFLMSDSMRIVKAPDGEEASLAGSFVLVGYFMVFGLLIAIGGLWQIKGHVIPAKARWNTVWLFIAGGILLQLVYLWINGQS